MAEGFLKSFDENIIIYSAGTYPASAVSSSAIRVMEEVGIDISKNFPKGIELFIDKSFDYVITVCDNAKESCPVFKGSVKHNLHIGFDDPADAVGTEEEILAVFRRVRDEIKRDFLKFYNDNIKSN